IAEIQDPQHSSPIFYGSKEAMALQEKRVINSGYYTNLYSTVSN
ncbi:9321_t:CDS:1, partial [Funneliformis mosseae]